MEEKAKVLKFNTRLLNFGGKVIEYAKPPTQFPFEFTIDTTNISGSDYELFFNSSYDYDAVIDWGDGNQSTVSSFNDPNKFHSYSQDGEYIIRILGLCEYIDFDNISYRNSLVSVNDWGNTNNFRYLRFGNCINLTTLPEEYDNKLSNLEFLSFVSCHGLEEVVIEGADLSSLTTLSFSISNNLKSVKIENCNLNSMTSSSIFNRCFDLEIVEFINTSMNSLESIYMFTRPTSGAGSTQLFDNLETINFINTSTQSLTSVSSPFRFCRNLKNINIDSIFDENNNVTSVTSLFSQPQSPNLGLTTLDVSNWKLTNVTNASSLFAYCSNLEEIIGLENIFSGNTNSIQVNNIFGHSISLKTLNLTGFTVNLNNSTNSLSMFIGCTSLEEIVGIENLNVSNFTNLNSMFLNCESLQNLNLSGWDTSNVISIENTFEGSGLIEIDISSWDTSNVITTQRMFRNCNNIETINLSGLDFSLVTDMRSMFQACYSLTEIIGINNSTITNVQNIERIFSDCSSLEELNLSNWNVSNLTSMATTSFGSQAFINCSSLHTLNITGWGNHQDSTLPSLFSGCVSLNNLVGYEDFIHSGVNDISSIFNNCESLPNLDLSGWDTSNVTNMSSVFRNCYTMDEIDITDWDISSVTNMVNMFSGCESLEELDLAGLNTSNVSSMIGMFQGCTLLETLNFTGLDISNAFLVTNNVNSMFRFCVSLKEIIGIEGTSLASKNTYLGYLFRGCESLESLDLNNWDVSGVTTFTYMFDGCISLQNLGISEWNFENITTAIIGINFLRNVTLSSTSYDAILIGIASQNVNNNVSISFGNSKYSSAAQTARDYLVNDLGWNISDGGLEV